MKAKQASSIDPQALHHPIYPCSPNFKDHDAYLRHLCREGIGDRYGFDATAACLTAEQQATVLRMNDELAIIANRGLANKLLVVWDIASQARQHGISIGPGHARISGSLVTYLLHITEIDPLHHGLLFELFVYPNSSATPCFYFDICERQLPALISCLRRTYGSDCVALADPVFSSNSSVVETESVNVIVADQPLAHLIPLDSQADEGLPVRLSFARIDELGLLHLKLNTPKALTLIRDTIQRIAESTGAEINLEALPLDDAKTFRTLRKRDPQKDIFQMAPAAFPPFCRKVHADRFEDIPAALVAASLAFSRRNRAKNRVLTKGWDGFMHDYLMRKSGRLKVEYDHPAMRPILEDTYGLIIFDVQLIQIAAKLAGLPIAQAVGIYRALRRRTESEICDAYAKFMIGCVAMDMNPDEVGWIWSRLCSDYDQCCMKSHAISRALLAYRLAWLKTHYPEQARDALAANAS